LFGRSGILSGNVSLNIYVLPYGFEVHL